MKVFPSDVPHLVISPGIAESVETEPGDKVNEIGIFRLMYVESAIRDIKRQAGKKPEERLIHISTITVPDDFGGHTVLLIQGSVASNPIQNPNRHIAIGPYIKVE